MYHKAKRLALLNYKKLGIKNFKNHKFDDALKYFSLAYEQTKDKNLLFYINLCVFAKDSFDEANMLFELFYAKEKKQEDTENLYELLYALENKHAQSEELEEEDAISYEEFMSFVRNSDFKSVFQNIMFSTKVMISNKDDFLDFIQNLIKNDFLDMSINYLESAATMFRGDERIDKLLEKVKERKNNEDTH